MKISIDPEFAKLIPPLSEDEISGLKEALLRDGCRDPLAIWKGQNVLLDGHHRYRICTEHKLPYETVAIALPDRETAADWIDHNSLARRNLTPDQKDIILGRRYNRQKGSHGGDRRSSGQNVHLKTAEHLARQHGVAEKTVRRAGRFAEAVDEMKALDPDIERKVVSGQGPPKRAVEKAAELLKTHPDKAYDILEGKKTTAAVIREIKREEIVAKLNEIAAREAKSPTGVFDVIVIDPPWPMEKIERDCRPNQTKLDYATMTEDELAGITIPAANDCHVWLWTTHRFLPMALRLLDHWKLKYVCAFVWRKPGGFQPIGLPQYNCEFALYARHGSPTFVDTTALPTCFEAPRGAHSEKPDAFYDTLRRVTAGRRLDMFNRRPIEGFAGWGKETQ